MPKVRMPDGKVVAFPDDMPREEIKAMITKKYPDAAKAPVQAATPTPTAQPTVPQPVATNATPMPKVEGSPARAAANPTQLTQFPDDYYIESRDPTFVDELYNMGKKMGFPVDRMIRDAQSIDDTVRNLAYGATFGQADRLVGALSGKGTKYERGKTAEALARNPGLGKAARFAGSMASAGGLTKAAPSLMGAGPGQGLVERIVAGGASGAAMGASESEAEGESPIHGAVAGAVAGGLVAPAVAGAFKLGGRFLNRMRGIETPTLTALHDEGDALMEAGRQAGVTIKQSAWKQGVDAVFNAAKRASPKINQEVYPVLQDFKNMSKKPITLDGIETQRKLINKTIRETPANDIETRDILSDMKDALTDWQLKLTAKDAQSGDPAAAVQLFQKGRKTWAARHKMEILDNTLSNADGSSQPYDAAIRTEFRKLERRRDFKFRWNTQEQKTIKEIVRSTSITSLIANLGRLGSYTVGPTGIGALIGHSLGGPVGAVAGASVGAGSTLAAQQLSGMSARGAASDLQHLVGTGSFPPMVRGAENFGRALGVTGGINTINPYIQPRKQR